MPTSSTVRLLAPAASVTRTCAVAARTLKPYAQLSGTRTRAAHRSDIFTSRPRQWPDFHHHQRVTQMIAGARTSKDNFFFLRIQKEIQHHQKVSAAQQPLG